MSVTVARPIVPRLFPDSTIVCLAGGPSLTQEDVDRCRHQHVIAIKEAVRLAPWAEIAYSSDARWWQHYGPLMGSYAGLRYVLEVGAEKWATPLQNAGERGLEVAPTGLRTGRSSGYAAINLAVHLGATRVVLLGYDCQPGPKGERNWFGPRPGSYWRALPPYDPSIMQCWPTLVEPLQALGVEVVNATPGTALQVFPRRPLAECLS